MPSTVIYVRTCDECQKTHSTSEIDLPDWPMVAYGNRVRLLFCSWDCMVAYAAKQPGAKKRPCGCGEKDVDAIAAAGAEMAHAHH